MPPSTSAFVRGENHGQQVSATAGSPQRVCHRRNLRGDSQHEEHEAGELPWIAVVFVSVTLAYALGSAAHGEGFSAGKQSEIHAAPSTGEATQAADVAQSTISLSETVAEPSASTFGGLSLTSPASTGHASPNGCCAWN